MRNRTYGGVRGRKTKVGEKLLRFPPTRLISSLRTTKNLIKEFRYFPKSCYQYDLCIKMHSFYDLFK